MRMLLLGMVMSLAFVACVRQSTYDGALAENRQLRADLASKDAELGAVKRENDAISVVLAEMRRQVQRRDDASESTGDFRAFGIEVISRRDVIRPRFVETRRDEVPAEPSTVKP
jgi:hypothetical protein